MLLQQWLAQDCPPLGEFVNSENTSSKGKGRNAPVRSCVGAAAAGIVWSDNIKKA